MAHGTTTGKGKMKQASKWLDELMEAADGLRDELTGGVEAEPDRNADGDSFEDMKKVWDEGNALDWAQHPDWIRWYTFTTDNYEHNTFAITAKTDANFVNHIRITAKHADKFAAACMDFETWARAAIARGMVERAEGDMELGLHKVCMFNRLTRGRTLFDSRDGHEWHLQTGPLDWTWTAITRAQYEQETAPTPEPRYAAQDGLMPTVLDTEDGVNAICHAMNYETANLIAKALNALDGAK